MRCGAVAATSEAPQALDEETSEKLLGMPSGDGEDPHRLHERRCSEQEESWGAHHLVLVCICLMGLLASAALAAATLGYEVGLNVAEPKVDEVVDGRDRGEEERRSPGRSSGHEGIDAVKVVAHPGPSVEDFSVELLNMEDELWKHNQRRWKEEEVEWRRKYAVNQTVFYMYRAQSSKEYPPVNINTADLGGVLWYLHHEIVIMTPRKFDVTRILRFQVTVKNTEVLHKAVFHDFGPFVAFDSGKCTVPTCDDIWSRYGFVVGCQVLDTVGAKYTRQVPCDSVHCHGGMWYSLPGPCPTMDFDSKSEDCKRGMPGGSCSTGDVTGEAHCTYHVEEAGYVDMDEYTLIRNYTGFIEEGRREYDPNTDKGVRFSFWDGIKDQSRCTWRMNRLQLLFKKKYPGLPAQLNPPACP